MKDNKNNKNKTVKVTCPVCGGTKFIFDPKREEVVCAICGYVFEKDIALLILDSLT